MHAFLSLGFLGLLFHFCGCGDPLERQLEIVLAGGEGREEALMELLFAKGEALPSLIAAVSDAALPAQGRADLVGVLWQLFLRESDQRILPALLGLVDDPAPQVRRAVAEALGFIERQEAVHPLLARLAVEADEDVQLQILRSVETLDGWAMDQTGSSSYLRIDGGRSLSAAQRADFTRLLQDLYARTGHDTLRQQAGEFLEKLAAQKVQEAQNSALRAEMERAEQEFVEALQIKPDSRNALMDLGKFYLLNGQRQRGLELLEAHGMVLRLTRLPALDGRLDDPPCSTPCTAPSPSAAVAATPGTAPSAWPPAWSPTPGPWKWKSPSPARSTPR